MSTYYGTACRYIQPITLDTYLTPLSMAARESAVVLKMAVGRSRSIGQGNCDASASRELYMLNARRPQNLRGRLHLPGLSFVCSSFLFC